MIEAFRQHLSAAWSRAARSLDARRRRLLTFGTGAVGTAIAQPFRTPPALVVARTPVATRQTLGYRTTERIRRPCGTPRL